MWFLSGDSGFFELRTLITKILKASNKGMIKMAMAKADPLVSKSNSPTTIVESTIFTAKTENKKPITKCY